MNIILCGDSAFVASGDLEQIPETGVEIVVKDLTGKTVSGSVSVFDLSAESAEVLCEIKDGKVTIPSAALTLGKRYKLLWVLGEDRVTAGEICVISDSALGLCVFPRRQSFEHLWDVCASFAERIGELGERLNDHIDGNEVV